MCVLPFNKKKAKSKKEASNRVGNKNKKVDLWMNALLESKLLRPRKAMNYLQPSLITSLRKVLLIQFVFITIWHEMNCKG